MDMGGTNLRICKITLHGRDKKQEGNDFDIMQHEFKLPQELKTGSAEQMHEFLVDSLQKFIKDQKLADKGETLQLGFTFSFPSRQDYIDHAVLQTWTKGFDIKGVEGEDVAQQLRDAIKKRVCSMLSTYFHPLTHDQNLPVQLVSVVNDTVGALIASSYNDPETFIGAIFGTGCNAAYIEDCGSISKLKGQLPPDTKMAINCEYGAFDNAHRVLPITKYDQVIDDESPRPGQQAFEKLSAGLYLGEILRLVMLDLAERGVLFKSQDNSLLKKAYSLDTAFLSAIENDESPKLRTTLQTFQKDLNITPTEPELEFLRMVSELVAIRGARLTACGPAAICTKKGIEHGKVAADGSVANKHPKFKARWSAALGEILDWVHDRSGEEPDDPIKLTSAEDGSGVGVAVITAMTWERMERGDFTGINKDSAKANGGASKM